MNLFNFICLVFAVNHIIGMIALMAISYFDYRRCGEIFDEIIAGNIFTAAKYQLIWPYVIYQGYLK